MVNSELYPEPLFQSEAKCEAIEMTATLLMQIKLIVTRKVLPLCSFWKWEFLELGSGLFTTAVSLDVRNQAKLTTREQLDNCQFD